MLSTTEEHLEEVFTKAAEPVAAGKKPVERVKKLKDYAFIHFSEREEALRALQALNGMSNPNTSYVYVKSLVSSVYAAH